MYCSSNSITSDDDNWEKTKKSLQSIGHGYIGKIAIGGSTRRGKNVSVYLQGSNSGNIILEGI